MICEKKKKKEQKINSSLVESPLRALAAGRMNSAPSSQEKEVKKIL